MFSKGSTGLDTSSASLGHNNAAGILPFSTSPVMSHNIPLAQNDDTIHFREIEGILIHYRNLIEFFFSKDSGDDLVRAQHYTGEDPKSLPPWAKSYKRRCSELLAHLTYSRSTHYRRTDEHHWPDIADKCDLMNQEIRAFLDSLPPERRAWFPVI